MELPKDREIYHTDIADFWFDDEGFLCCNANATERTINNLNSTFKLVEEISGGKKVCLVPDITNTGVQNKKERDFATAMMPRYYKAMAIISRSDFGNAIANIFLTLYNLPIPMKLFKSELQAKEWIKRFL
jgi:hypothetical protein